jgi:multiple antibiotic resistance protein
MFELYVSSLITFFVVIDPPGCAPIFAGLTAGTSTGHRHVMAVRAVSVATIILLVFALFGEDLLRGLGIQLASFRIAGGIMLFLIALEMVFEKRTQRREDRAAKVVADHEDDISIFPMAMPMIAGPGSIASVMLLSSRHPGFQPHLIVLGALATILLLTLVAQLLAVPGITRLLGVLLAALAVQFVLDGLQVSFR